MVHFRKNILFVISFIRTNLPNKTSWYSLFHRSIFRWILTIFPNIFWYYINMKINKLNNSTNKYFISPSSTCDESGRSVVIRFVRNDKRSLSIWDCIEILNTEVHVRQSSLVCVYFFFSLMFASSLCLTCSLVILFWHIQ